MKKTIFTFTLILIFLTAPLYAQRTYNIASVVPANSEWGRVLDRLAAEWTRATNNEINFKVFHDSVAGTELDVLRKLKMNEIQIAVFSTVGLSAIAPEIMTLSVPFMIRTDAELDIILENAKGDLERLMNSKGVHVLAWARAGWVRFFTKTPVFTPAELKRVNLGTVEGQPQLTQTFRTMGYQLVPVDTSQMLFTLNSGRIDGFFHSPLIVAGNQFFGITNHMTNLNIAPVMGGLVINQQAWRTIPERYRSRILEIGKSVEKEMDNSIIRLETEAINTMKQYGLIIHDVTPAQAQAWYDDTDKAMPNLLGRTYDRTLYNRFTAILRDYRARR